MFDKPGVRANLDEIEMYGKLAYDGNSAALTGTNDVVLVRNSHHRQLHIHSATVVAAAMLVKTEPVS